jgi:hypothetical protein
VKALVVGCDTVTGMNETTANSLAMKVGDQGVLALVSSPKASSYVNQHIPRSQAAKMPAFSRLIAPPSTVYK